jgi:hypothetical protein
MKITDEELQVLEELRHYGTPLDGTVLQEARAARQSLEIMQTGNSNENIVYARSWGEIGLSMVVDIENTSDEIIHLKAACLKMPWPAPDFHWLDRPSAKELREYGGYTLAACGQHAFDPARVLNQCFVRDFKLCPRDRIEGYLLGEGRAWIPYEYQVHKRIPMQLVVYTRRGGPYLAWVKLALRREGQQSE